jgi:DNA-binding transcriptional LysR family regulator
MIDSLKAMGVFAKVVELRSFREAARALSLSPSVVSHHVSSLEKKLGLSLLYRSTRHLALTADGEALYQSAREMLAAAQRGLDATESARTGGHLRMTAPAFFAETEFCRDLSSFTRANPTVRMSVGFTDVRRDLVREGLDLAIRIGHLHDSALKVKRLATMRRVLVASPRYLEARKKPKSIRDLRDFSFIHLSAVRPELALIPPGKKSHQVVGYEPRIAVDTATGMRAMALAGLGVASQPEVLARAEIARGRLVEVLPGWRMLELGVFAVWPAGAARPPLTSRFVDFIEARVKALFAG